MAGVIRGLAVNQLDHFRDRVVELASIYAGGAFLTSERMELRTLTARVQSLKIRLTARRTPSMSGDDALSDSKAV
jgi:hypothetical protein